MLKSYERFAAGQFGAVVQAWGVVQCMLPNALSENQPSNQPFNIQQTEPALSPIGHQ